MKKINNIFFYLDMNISTDIYYILKKKNKHPETILTKENALLLIASHCVYNMSYADECSQSMELIQLITGIKTNFRRSRQKKNFSSKRKF